MDEYYIQKFHRDLADALAAVAAGDWREAARAFENRVAYDCQCLATEADRRAVGATSVG